MAGEPIVGFYIKNFKRNGTVVTTETLFQSIPMSSDPVITEPKVKNEMGKSGSFEFGMERTSSIYDALIQLRTIIRVTYFGHTIFRGRVLTIDKTLARKRTVHCEGDFSFLLDSHQLGTKEEDRKEITVLAYLQSIINQHNSDMTADDDKKFTLGQVPGQYTNAIPALQRVTIPTDKAKQKFGDTSWNTSMDRLENLLSDFGGYFRTRYDDSGNTPVVYLDWFDNFYNSSVNTQTVETTKNLIDLSGPTEVDSIFTMVVPLGKKDSKTVLIGDYWPVVSPGHAKRSYITVRELVSEHLYTDAELNTGYHKKSDYENAINNFGKIWKTVEFENANTPEKLFNYAKDWIKNNFMPSLTQWTVSALDLKFVDSTNQVILCGDRITLVHPEVDQTYPNLTVISATYDLYNPEKNQYIIGIPNQEKNAAYGVKEKTGKGGGGSGGGISKKPQDKSDDVEEDLEALKQSLQTQYSMKTDWKVDTSLDDPYAFLQYSNMGKELGKEDAASKTTIFQEAVNKVRDDPVLSHLMERDANARGVGINDPQLLIDWAPGMTEMQEEWQQQTVQNLVSVVGLTQQEAEVLVYDSSGKSWLASLVDDDGEWTQKAIDDGVTTREEAAKIKEMAVNTRQILSGKKTLGSAGIFNGAVDMLVGGDLNIHDWIKTNFNIDLDSKEFNIGDLFNLDETTNEVTGLTDKFSTILDGVFSGSLFGDGSTEFNLESVTAAINGLLNGGNAGFGTGGLLDGWKVTINQPYAYTATGPDGQQHAYVVSSGEVAANDFHFTAKYDSLYAKLLVTDNLVANCATISQLNAAKARIETLESDAITANNINTKLASVGILQTHGISNTGLISSTSGAQFSGPVYASNFHIGTPDGSKGVSHALLGGEVRRSSDSVSIVGFDFDGNEVNFTNTINLSSISGVLSAHGISNSGTLSSTGVAQFGGAVYGPSFHIGSADGSKNVAAALVGGKVVQNGDDYSIVGYDFNGNEINFTGTFSRATTLAGTWSGGVFTVNASPQGESYTASILDVPKVDVTWSGNTASLPLKSDINGSGRATLTGKTITVDASGRDAASGTASGRSGTTYKWIFQIKRGDNTTKNLTIDCSAIYSDARVGYTMGTFTQRDVTPQGDEHKVTPISGSGIRLGSATTRYVQSSDTYTVQGSAGPKLYHYGSKTLYTSDTPGSMSLTQDWYYVSSSSVAKQYYNAGATSVHAAVASGTARQVLSSGGTLYYTAGSELTLYDAGTVSHDYYKKS